MCVCVRALFQCLNLNESDEQNGIQNGLCRAPFSILLHQRKPLINISFGTIIHLLGHHSFILYLTKLLVKMSSPTALKVV